MCIQPGIKIIGIRRKLDPNYTIWVWFLFPFFVVCFHFRKQSVLVCKIVSRIVISKYSESSPLFRKHQNENDECSWALQFFCFLKHKKRKVKTKTTGGKLCLTRCIPVADELMVAGVVHCNICFSQMPNGTFNAMFSWCVHFAYGTELISLWMWQAQFYCQRPQSPVFLQEEKSPCGVKLCVSGINPPHVGHQSIVVV